MHVDLMFPSLYLKAADFQGKDAPLTIRAIEREELRRNGGKTEQKWVVYFQETLEKARATGKDEKRLVLNKTNANLIAKALGETEADNWIGRKVTLYPTTTSFGRSTVDCIRVRDRAPADDGASGF